MKKAKAASGTRRNYKLASYNCEHFATECKTGRGRSGQVTTTVTVGSTIGVPATIVGILTGILAIVICCNKDKN